MPPLWRRYAGLSLSDAQVKKSGESARLLGMFGAQEARKRALRIGLADGRVKREQLSPADAQLMGVDLTRLGSLGKNVDSGPSDFFDVVGNFLGDKGLLGAVTSIPMGVYTTGKSIGEDVLNDPTKLSLAKYAADILQGDTKLNKNVISPTGEGFKRDFNAVVTEGLGKGNWKPFLKEPFGPVLDVATIASLGAGGVVRGASVMGRVGMGGRAISRIAQLGERAGRPALAGMDTRGVAGAERVYSGSPTMKFGVQKPLDLLGRKFSPVGRLQQRWEANQLINRLSGASRLRGERAANLQAHELVPLLRRLTPEEWDAYLNLTRGLSTKELIEARRADLVKSLEGKLLHGEENYNIGDYAGLGVTPDSAKRHLEILGNTKVLEHTLNPTKGMKNLHQKWKEMVEQRQLAQDIAAEPYLSAVKNQQSRLLGKERIQALGGEVPIPEHGIGPTYTPSLLATGFKYDKPGRFAQWLGRRSGEPQFVRDKTGFRGTGTINPKPLTDPFEQYLQDVSLASEVAGATRRDPGILIDHVKAVERNAATKLFNDDMVKVFGLKDDAGEVVTALDNHEMGNKVAQAGLEPKDYVLLHPQGALRMLDSKQNLLTDITRAVRTLEEEGKLSKSLGMGTRLEGLEAKIEGNAQAFVRDTAAAVKQPGVIVPRAVAKHASDLIMAETPYTGFGAGVRNAYAKYINLWRRYVLAFMPRWLLNTAVGSGVINTIKGVGPRYYWHAWASRQNRGRALAGVRGALSKDDTLSLARGSHPMNPRYESLPPEVSLGSQSSQEALVAPQLDSGAGLLGQRILARKLYHGVQGVEDFFRRASYFHSADKAAKATMGVKGFEMPGWRAIIRKPEYWDELEKHPNILAPALDELDKFAYNFAALGPKERRIMRQIVPFWGWYKFSTRLVYRLPIEYPGRTRAILALRDIAANAEKDGGWLPDWLRGAIPLSLNKNGQLTYLPTLGMNPLSQPASPFSSEGLWGLMRIGQLNPVLQAGLAAGGVNTMNPGETLPISPESGLVSDFNGQLINKQGEVVSPASEFGLERAVGSLLRSFPQMNMLERVSTGGRSPYPESIPLVAQRPMPTRELSRQDAGEGATLLKFLGVGPRKFDLGYAQQQRLKREQYYPKRLLRAKRLKEKRR